MHEYVETFITYDPHVHNIASQIMGTVYFETFQSLRLTNTVAFTFGAFYNTHHCESQFVRTHGPIWALGLS
jgi:hypothetical protein